jgi:CRP-like cAMP-binding protein
MSPRLATVTATSPMRLLLEPSHLNRLMTEAPPLAARVREAMRTRLATV